ncbi:MAG: DUF2298 domain-containing protein [Chloroflexota bacterium]
MAQAIVWLLIIELIGLLALPATFAFFSFLPDRGYTLTKTFGLLGGAFVVWFLGMLGLPFTALTSWVLLVVLFGGLGFWLLQRKDGELRADIDRFFREQRWLMLAVELLFIATYLYLVNLRSYMPEIRDQEKFGDFAFLNSMALHSTLPPTDPWMSGYPINYYYFSHFMMAMLTKMSGVVPAIAFNLTSPLIFGLTALGAFGVVYNLVMAVRQTVSRPALRGWLAAGLTGVLAALSVGFLGNLDSARIALFPSGNMGGFTYNWWSPSRVISDFMPQPMGNGLFSYHMIEAITEFPFFSFLLADIHPHVMTLPFALLVIAAAFNLLRIPADSGLLDLHTSEGRYFFIWLALIVGSLYFLNSLDYPTYLLLILMAALVRELRVGLIEQKPDELAVSGEWWKVALFGGKISSQLNGQTWRRFWRWLGFTVRLLIASVGLYLPFHLTFTSFIGDSFVPDAVNLPILSSLAKTFLLVAWDRTPLLVQTIIQENGQPVDRWGYLMVFGLFLYPIVSMIALKLWPYLKAPYGYLDGEPLNSETAEKEVNKTLPFGSFSYYVTGFGLFMLLLCKMMALAYLNPVIILLVGLFSVPFLAIGVGWLATEYLEKRRSSRPVVVLLSALGVLALLMIVLGWSVHFELYGPLLILGISATLLILCKEPFERRKEPLQAENHTADSLELVDKFGLLLVVLPVLITFVIEIIFLRDVFNARFNTIFKFYYQAWVLYALAGAYATWRVVAWGWKLVPFGRTARYLEETESEKTQNPAYFVSAPPQASPLLGAAGSSGISVALEFQAPSSSPVYADGTEEDADALAAEEYIRQRPRSSWWRWIWAFGLTLLLLAGLIYPLFGPYEKSGNYKQRKGLDGADWLAQWYPDDYTAIKWLQTQSAKDPSFEGPLLETVGPDWFDYNRVGTFSGFPVLMGWPGHEQQWRGGKAATRTEVTERIQAVDRIYSTTSVEEARNLLQKYGLKYVYVGTLETSANDGRWYDGNGNSIKKNYPAEGLTKFSLFMKRIYQQNGVTIYSF